MADFREQVLKAARGHAVHLSEGAPRLSVFRLTNRFDAQIDKDDLANAGILFITEATHQQLTEQVDRGGAYEVVGSVVNLAGEVVGEPSIKVETAYLCDMTKAQVFVMSKLHLDLQKLSSRGGRPEQACRGRALIAFFKAGVDDAQCDLRGPIDAGRWEVSSWFERDRSNVCLTDNITGQEVFNLWDDDVQQAIEDGFLRRPRTGSSNSEWVQPALEYARDQGLMNSLTLEPPRAPARSAQEVTAAQTEFERPRA